MIGDSLSAVLNFFRLRSSKSGVSRARPRPLNVGGKPVIIAMPLLTAQAFADIIAQKRVNHHLRGYRCAGSHGTSFSSVVNCRTGRESESWDFYRSADRG
jgi:hypothetical protein